MFAAIPALLGSLVLMNVAGAPRALWAQQAIVAATATVTVFFAARHSKAKSAVIGAPWLLLGMAALVCAPLLGVGSPAPRRWLEFSGIRLYVASAVLPVFLLVWHRGLAGDRATTVMSSVAVAFTALALFLQPDAAQLTALAIASLPILWSCSGGRLVARSTLAALPLLLAAAVSWRSPDPLAPVPYVEGVFVSAAGYSDWALVAAVLAAALPVMALGWLARRTRSPGIFAVTLYYAVLYLLAPAQVTPVPLLGFGAGPILGYFVMAYFVTALLRHGPCRTGLPGLVLAARSTTWLPRRALPALDEAARRERAPYSVPLCDDGAGCGRCAVGRAEEMQSIALPRVASAAVRFAAASLLGCPALFWTARRGGALALAGPPLAFFAGAFWAAGELRLGIRGRFAFGAASAAAVLGSLLALTAAPALIHKGNDLVVLAYAVPFAVANAVGAVPGLLLVLPTGNDRAWPRASVRTFTYAIIGFAVGGVVSGLLAGAAAEWYRLDFQTSLPLLAIPGVVGGTAAAWASASDRGGRTEST